MLKAQNAFTTKNMEILKENYFSYYSEHPYDLVNAYSGLETALTNLKNKGIALAVATNKPQNLAEVITERLYGGSLFTYVFGATPNRILKPDPQIVEEILAVSGFKKEETVMVGDLDVDILTGINAGISTICVKWGYATPEREINLKKLKIDYIVNTPEELQEIF
jgi:phosphoglycolate phosphatase